MLEADGDRPILKDNFIGAPLGLAKLLRLQRAGNIDGARFRAQMKTDGRRVEHFNQHRRQQMLAGVLLHVIEAARRDRFARPLSASLLKRIAQNMRDAVPFIDHFDDR